MSGQVGLLIKIYVLRNQMGKCSLGKEWFKVPKIAILDA